MNIAERKSMDRFLDEREANRGENPLYGYRSFEIDYIVDANEGKPNVYKQVGSAPVDGISGAPEATYTMKE